MRIYFSDDYGAARFAFATTRKAMWIAESLRERPIPGVELVAPRPLSAEEMSVVHDPAYIEALRTGIPADLAQSQGFSWDPGLWRSISAMTGGAVAAALGAYHSGGTAGSLSSGLHHARRERGAGLCSVNGLALAAHAARAQGAHNGLILDLDAHAGGGTHSLIAQDPHISQLDVSVNGYDAYATDRPGDRFVLMDNASSLYLPTLRELLNDPQYDRRFDLVLYNAGMDPSGEGVTADELADRERTVFQWAREHGSPIAFVIAGGYLSRERLVVLHRLTIRAAAGTLDSTAEAA